MPQSSKVLQFRISETWHNQTWDDFFYIEVYRTHLAETRFKQKIRAYVSCVETGLHEALFQTPAFSIAVITTTEHLKTTLKQWTEETLAEIHRPQEGEQFFFRCFDPATISPTELFLAPVWQQAFGTGFTPLLLLEEEQ